MSFIIVERSVVAMISSRTCCVLKEDVVLPRLFYCDSRCSQTCRQRFQVCRRRSQVLPDLSYALPGLSPTLPGAPKVLSGAPRCSQTYHNHSHGTPVAVIRDPSYSEGRPECPPRVWYSPEIDASKFTLHILSDTPGVFRWRRYILLIIVVRLCHHWISTSSVDPTANHAADIVHRFSLNLRLDPILAWFPWWHTLVDGGRGEGIEWWVDFINQWSIFHSHVSDARELCLVNTIHHFSRCKWKLALLNWLLRQLLDKMELWSYLMNGWMACKPVFGQQWGYHLPDLCQWFFRIPWIEAVELLQRYTNAAQEQVIIVRARCTMSVTKSIFEMIYLPLKCRHIEGWSFSGPDQSWRFPHTTKYESGRSSTHS